MDVMIDLETLDTKPTSLILSVGFVLFDPKSDDTFAALLQRTESYVVDLELSKGFFSMSSQTLGWWLDKHLHEFVRMQGQPKLALRDILKSLFDRILNSVGDQGCVWANSPSFDLEILKHAAGQCNLPPFPVEVLAGTRRAHSPWNSRPPQI